jgi:hypothetical protein
MYYVLLADQAPYFEIHWYVVQLKARLVCVVGSNMQTAGSYDKIKSPIARTQGAHLEVRSMLNVQCGWTQERPLIYPVKAERKDPQAFQGSKQSGEWVAYNICNWLDNTAVNLWPMMIRAYSPRERGSSLSICARMWTLLCDFYVQCNARWLICLLNCWVWWGHARRMIQQRVVRDGDSGASNWPSLGYAASFKCCHDVGRVSLSAQRHLICSVDYDIRPSTADDPEWDRSERVPQIPWDIELFGSFHSAWYSGCHQHTMWSEGGEFKAHAGTWRILIHVDDIYSSGAGVTF